MWYVRPAKAQTSLRIRAVWSEHLLVAWIFYDCSATDWKAFGDSKLKRRLHRLIWVYTCQNATLLEIKFCGSNKFKSKKCKHLIQGWESHLFSFDTLLKPKPKPKRLLDWPYLQAQVSLTVYSELFIHVAERVWLQKKEMLRNITCLSHGSCWTKHSHSNLIKITTQVRNERQHEVLRTIWLSNISVSTAFYVCCIYSQIFFMLTNNMISDHIVRLFMLNKLSPPLRPFLILTMLTQNIN